MKNLKLILTTAVLASLIGCVNGDDYGTPDLSTECVTIAKTKEVTDITGIATSAATQYTTTDNIDYIEAYVTSSDEGGNFFKSISMISTDGVTGFSMPVDNYNLYTEFEPGRKVTIKLDKNRYFNRQFGSTVLGSSFNNGVGRISSIEYKDVILRSCEKVDEATIVNNITITQAKNDQNLNKLIEFDAVQFTDASLGKKYYDPSLNSIGGATNHEITDEFGNKVIVRISEYANFAANGIPSFNGKIRGVMTKFNSDYQFMIRTLKDVNLTNPRLDIDLNPPLGGSAIVYDATLNEPFTSYTSNNQQVFPKYINDAAVGSRYWQRKTFGGNTYIQMSSFGGTPEANRTLFIVPVNMTAASTFSFATNAGFHNGNVLKVYYTTDYVPGSQITSATLVDITSSFTISPGLPSGYPSSFTQSGVYNIPAGVTGNGFFVFEYVGNGTFGPTTTMQIDNIVIN
ncbi:DUF5689 domain-containing protein [Flavobacterium cucumis]|uniref:DUF5689 domain-containing protein n=1 Tax=Flavobacterium cucumis TaxID=416016 RepID=A0A1M7ZV48_9FLAO|nr:DUF5689 domain-containing protein [Flavobacterium cucumis]SHO72507.1 hypothetical protein SAMN05443547_0841 [Flavobacterium cucumis]